jgi:hypothetical protein
MGPSGNDTLPGLALPLWDRQHRKILSRKRERRAAGAKKIKALEEAMNKKD